MASRYSQYGDTRHNTGRLASGLTGSITHSLTRDYRQTGDESDGDGDGNGGVDDGNEGEIGQLTS